MCYAYYCIAIRPKPISRGYENKCAIQIAAIRKDEILSLKQFEIILLDFATNVLCYEPPCIPVMYIEPHSPHVCKGDVGKLHFPRPGKDVD